MVLRLGVLCGGTGCPRYPRWCCAAIVFVVCSVIHQAASASALPVWKFEDSDAPSWRALEDIGTIRRTAEGLVIVPSGPVPTLAVSLAGVASEDVSFVRLRVRTPTAITGAYLAWSSVDSSGREVNSGIKFDIPRQLRGGYGRTIWVRVGGVADWSGDVRWLGLAIPVERTREDATVIESVALVQETFLERTHIVWTALAFDEAAEDMAVPILSLNTIRSARFDYGTPYGMASIIALLGMLGFGVSRWVRRPHSERFVRCSAIVVIGLMVTTLAVVAIYLEVFALRIERAVFGGTSASHDYRYLDGVDLVDVAADLNDILPVGTSVAVCFFGSDSERHIMSNRVRYQFYPIKVLPKAKTLLAFSGREQTCGVSPEDRLVDRPLYTLYRSP